MKPGLTVGMTKTVRVVVDTERTIGFMFNLKKRLNQLEARLPVCPTPRHSSCV